jgi:hypothetical protein
VRRANLFNDLAPRHFSDCEQRSDLPVQLVGLSSRGRTELIEIVVTIKGCHESPCQLLLNLSRGSREALEAELRPKLCDQLRTHASRA